MHSLCCMFSDVCTQTIIYLHNIRIYSEGKRQKAMTNRTAGLDKDLYQQHHRHRILHHTSTATNPHIHYCERITLLLISETRPKRKSLIKQKM